MFVIPKEPKENDSELVKKLYDNCMTTFINNTDINIVVTKIHAKSVVLEKSIYILECRSRVATAISRDPFIDLHDKFGLQELLTRPKFEDSSPVFKYGTLFLPEIQKRTKEVKNMIENIINKKQYNLEEKDVVISTGDEEMYKRYMKKILSLVGNEKKYIFTVFDVYTYGHGLGLEHYD